MTSKNEIKMRFWSSIKRGTGEAYLIQLSNPEIDFSSLIIKASTKNYAIDQQSEGSRAKYIFKIISKSKNKESIKSKILKSLELEKRDFHGLRQMADLAVEFYKSGDQHSKVSLLKRFRKNLRIDYDFVGQQQLIEVFGIEGLLIVAEYIGKLLVKHPNEVEDSWLVDEYQKKNKSIDVLGTLKEYGKHNKHINAYYESVRKNKFSLATRTKHLKYDYDIVKDKIDNGRLLFLSEKRANELNDLDFGKLAKELLFEKDPVRLRQYLNIFSHRKYPNGYENI